MEVHGKVGGGKREGDVWSLFNQTSKGGWKEYSLLVQRTQVHLQACTWCCTNVRDSTSKALGATSPAQALTSTRCTYIHRKTQTDKNIHNKNYKKWIDNDLICFSKVPIAYEPESNKISNNSKHRKKELICSLGKWVNPEKHWLHFQTASLYFPF